MRTRLLGGLAALCGSAGLAVGQGGLPPLAPADLPRQPFSLPAPEAVPAPSIQTEAPRQSATLSLAAFFNGSQRPIRAGLVWRIFEEKPGQLAPELVTTLSQPNPTATLMSGTYIIHAAYGLASTSRRLQVVSGAYSERIFLAAGALRLGGAIENVPIPPEKLSFSIYAPFGSDSEGRLVASNVKAAELIRLPEGSYHVVSTYGESNAIMRADLKVDTGQITDATMNHRAATVTLKLVAQPGGEAFAGTSFSVLTPGGDVIREAIGAFPTVTLAEGEYVVIARHDGKVYTREVKVESGIGGDVEVVANL